MVLQSIGNFKIEFAVVSIIIIVLMSAAVIAIPYRAYSQSIPFSVPKSKSINTATNRAVVLTFDDGYKNQYTNAKPILDKYGYKATFYIVCNYAEKNGRLKWEDITALYNEGHDIGSHTMNHADLSQTSKKETQY
jgi:peptidoglycan/xylan/chitin deacetylase (PgdA/CDA1 family)